MALIHNAAPRRWRI